MAFCRLAMVAGVLLVLFGVFHLGWIFLYQYQGAFEMLADMTSAQRSEFDRLIVEDIGRAISRVLAGIGLAALGEIGEALRKLDRNRDKERMTQ